MNNDNLLCNFLLLWVVLFVFQSKAKAEYNAINKGVIKASEVCLLSPKECLTVVDKKLKNTPTHSYLWFGLLQHKFDALYNLQRIEDLNKAIIPWLENERLPESFLITIYIYYAKTSLIDNNIDRAREYSEKAKNKIQAMNNVFPSPMRLVTLANLQMELEEDEEAYQTLQALEQKFKSSRNPHFKMELFGNLGHITRRLSLPELSLNYWIKALRWSKEFDNKQQIGTVLYALANAYFNVEKYAFADKYFTQAEGLSKSAGDEVRVNQIKLRLVEVKLKQQELMHAKNIFQTINQDLIPIYYKDKLEALGTSIDNM